MQNLLGRLLIYFVVVWMAVFYPAVCQYHGLLLFGSSAMQSQHQAQMAADAMTARHEHALLHPTAQMSKISRQVNPDASNHSHEASTPLLRHKTIPLDAPTLSLYALALPLAISFNMPQPRASQNVMVLSLAHQHQTAPPDQPPRLSLA
jgi:hypothetical protein